MDARHRFLAVVANDAFGLGNPNTVEATMSEHVELFEEFFKGSTRMSTVFIAYQPRLVENELGKLEPHGAHEIQISAQMPHLVGKCVYFARGPTVDAKNGITAKSIENDVSCGEVTADGLDCLQSTLQDVFVPILSGMNERMWESAKQTYVDTLVTGMSKFGTDIGKASASLRSGVKLAAADQDVVARVEIKDGPGLAVNMEGDDDAAEHFNGVLESWCAAVEESLAGDESSGSDDAGPLTELEYWRGRQSTFNGLTEQLKARACKVVLVAAGQSRANALKKWRTLDNQITDAANEAKDNVKYLLALEKYVEPLYSGDTQAIIDGMPALLNNIKMMHTIARYYNTSERMTTLFCKVTNEMITNCKTQITNGGKVWDQDISVLIQKLEASLALNDTYQDQYRQTKQKLETQPKGKQFDFSENQIFGRFELFCKRIQKLIDMFSTVQQFTTLAEHKIEGMEHLIKTFFGIVEDFKKKPYDLLDYTKNQFDRDYLEFNVSIHELETALQGFINSSFENIMSTEHALGLLKQFQAVLQRDNLKADLDSKYMVIFHNYGLDLETVQKLYEKHKNNPPMSRNEPPVTGNIKWARQLLRRIEEPMRKFQANKNIMTTKESKKIIRTYNKVARALIEFETLWHYAWTKSIDSAKAGLNATLIIRHPENDKLYVNFDREIMQLIRETKCLQRIGVEVPDSAKMVLLQEDKFKSYYNRLSFVLKEYDRVVQQLIPVIRPLLRRQLDDLEGKLRVGMDGDLTWTSMSIDGYLTRTLSSLERFDELVHKLNDIVENRVEAVVREIGKTLLVDLPEDDIVTCEEFTILQDKLVKSQSEWMDQKNFAVENAVEDLLGHVRTYSPEGGDPWPEDIDMANRIRDHYSRLMYRAILNATKNSMNCLKKRIASTGAGGFLFVERPFFDVDVELSIPQVAMNPSLEDIQLAINRTAMCVLKCSKGLLAWGTTRSSQGEHSDGEDKPTFFDLIAREPEIVKNVLLLTGAFEGTKQQVAEYMQSFRQYDWLWKDDMNAKYATFMKTNPGLEEFEKELQYYMGIESDIGHIPPVHNIGALSLETQPLKESLKLTATNWKTKYAQNLHEQAKSELDQLNEYIKQTSKNLSRPISDLEDVRAVMLTLAEVREKEAEIDQQFGPVEEMYGLLHKYQVRVEKEEMDGVEALRYNWKLLRTKATSSAENLQKVQAGFKRELTRSVKQFITDVSMFRSDWDTNGPLTPGIAPMEAVDRLKNFDNGFQTFKRKWDTYSGGEELFGLPVTDYPELLKTEKEIQYLNRIYGLYVKVVSTIGGYSDFLWVDVVAEIDAMTEEVAGFQAQMKKLPRALRELDAYEELRSTVEDFLETLPLLQMLSNEAMRPRHWKQIMKECGVELDVFNTSSFKLSDLMQIDFVKYAEEVEDIASSSVKELAIDVKLAQIMEQWEDMNFEFMNYKSRGPVCLQGVPEIMEVMEETQMNLGSMMSSRYVLPFKDQVSVWVGYMGTVAEIIEEWMIVQNMWMYMEAVFASGDIKNQLPAEAKKFAGIDKSWIKIMTYSFDKGNVVQCCCSTELLKSTLPSLNEALESIQKSLTGYLETKRNIFARFYFVSDPVLLEILSQGSQPELIQQHLPAVFDSIMSVTFDKKDKAKITGMISPQDELVAFSEHLNVQATGAVEDWLGRVVMGMRMTIKDNLRLVGNAFTTTSLEDSLSTYPAQSCLILVQFLWTHLMEDAIKRMKTEKGALSGVYKAQNALLDEMIVLTTQENIPGGLLAPGGKNKTVRKNLETQITVHVHQVEVAQDLAKLKTKNLDDFDWQKQCRFYWRGEIEDDAPGEGGCVISCTDVDFQCCYEYCGVNERLCITALTDKCYITLSQAIGMYLGGAPAGPAGTGKTETVKDLGRTLMLWVVVTNCSDQMDYKACGKIFKGLAMTGAWGCFDEFNRIDLEVLSVVASQVLCVEIAQRSQAREFTFTDGQKLGMDPKCCFFITMNPGYAGRNELPENLKSLFRGVAMMVPNRQTIMTVKLAACGYKSNGSLGKKFHVLYRLCEQQLSKQTHYDFGLRNILSVLRTCGTTKRRELEKPEALLFMRTVRDMNLSKFVADDVPLFVSLISDSFPGLKAEKARYMDVEAAIEDQVGEQKLQMHEDWVAKVVQLYETYLVRHGIMVVGPSGCGKTSIWNTLSRSLSQLGTPTKELRMNPKAITAQQMFGTLDAATNDWTDGIFSALWRVACKSKKEDIWLVADGPVDAIWIENLNTVLDDNKLLTLANGDRIMMGASMKMCFEPDNLLNASPATVSRAGIIYVSDSILGWWPPVCSWLETRRQKEQELLKPMFDTIGRAIVEEIRRNIKQAMFVPDIAMFASTCVLLEALLEPSVAEDSILEDAIMEKVFCWCLCWGVGAMHDLEERVLFDAKLRDLTSILPPLDEQDPQTVYEYFVDLDSGNWEHWNTMIPEYVYDPNMEFSQAFVPTLDSTRYLAIIDYFSSRKTNVLICGDAGTTKSATINNYILGKLAEDSDSYQSKNINFSFQTTHNLFQATIEGVVEKRQGKTFGPSGGKSMFVFIDDVSMPEINDWGDQPTNEIVRQLLDYGYIYDHVKPGTPKFIVDMIYYGAMATPGGGKNDMPNRLKRQFNSLNMTLPAKASIDNIFGSILRGRFVPENFDEGVVELAGRLTELTITLWDKIKAKMLPTPATFHYLFNMRDLSRTFQGVMLPPDEVICDANVMMGLWKHECERVFMDKLVTNEDKAWVAKAMAALVKDGWGDQFDDLLNDGMYFANFQREPIYDDEGICVDENPKVYEPIPDLPKLVEKVYTKMNEFNETSKILKLDLVMFRDAMAHMMRISRILGMPRGSALLVGVGGSGKQSLTRLASFIAGNFTFQITLTKTYNTTNLFDDLKTMYAQAGVNGTGVSFVFTDGEIKEESFLEVINNLLSTGEVPGMYPKDEIEAIVGDMRAVAKRDAPKGFIDTYDNLYNFFIDRVRDNLHVILCFSPIGEKFRNRARMFPGLFACCSIDWFLAWPQEALADVAAKYLGRFDLDADDKVKKEIVQHCAFVHQRVTLACDEYFEKYRRQVYVTPKSYLTFIEEYQTVYKQKYQIYNDLKSNLKVGLDKLLEAGEDVARMQEDLKLKFKDLEEAQRVSKALLVEIQASTAKAEKKKTECAAVAASAGEESAKAGEIKAVVETDLLAAKPALDDAAKALDAIKPKDIQGLKALKAPPEIIQRIMDTVLILLHFPLEKPLTIIEGKVCMVYAASYKNAMTYCIGQSTFLDMLKSFPKENINDETVELLQPYLDFPDFTVESAAKASGSMAGLCAWCAGMSMYQQIAKVVGPKMMALKAAEKAEAKANKSLNEANAELAVVQASLDEMQREFDKAMADKQALQDDADATQKRADAANALLAGLAGEKSRWTVQLGEFADTIKRLVGDVALACSFISYCGPYNQEFRTLLLNTYFYEDCIQRGVPVTKDLDVVPFLTTEAEMGEWALEGLPSDGLSIQNGILVTRSSRWPLLIDPQGQAHSWISSRESANGLKITQLSEKMFRNTLEECMGYGKPLLIENIAEELDPVLDPVLLKQIIWGRSPKIQLSDKECDYNEAFSLAITTKLPNPLYTPELSAKVTIIDFTVTMGGLEDQLLGAVISVEKPELEEQRAKLLADVNANKKTMKELQDDLLYRLANASGSLLDDSELIGVLSESKKTAIIVEENLKNAAETEIRITETREEYRPVAIRGSVLYFLISSMTEVDNMYNVALSQFMELFFVSCQRAEKAPLAKKRINNIIEALSYTVYAYVQRGLFTRHKLMFAFLMTMKIAIRGGPFEIPGVPAPDAWLTQPEFDCILKGGAALDINAIRKKPFAWIPDLVWANVIAATEMPGLSDLADCIYRNEGAWRNWFELEAPEQADIPDFQERGTPFQICLITRSFRNDRTLPAVTNYVRTESGEQYVDSIPVDMFVAYQETIDCGHGYNVPFVHLLSPGADPTAMIEDLAKKNKKKTPSVSMGQGQEVIARSLVSTGMLTGDWCILQNCHLGLGYLSELEGTLVKAENCHEEFRVFITVLPHPLFPIGLLQMAIKITNEAPVGVKAGMKRNYFWVTQDLLDTISRAEWRHILYVMCFCHCVVQERRKFGSIGWAIPYEYNQSDLTACCLFLQNHMSAMESQAPKGGQVPLQWATVRFMISNVQYGGKITDDLDGNLMDTYAAAYFQQPVMDPSYTFYEGYGIPSGPESVDIDFWRKEISKLPETDTPEIFGLHVNADITFRNKQTNEMIGTIIDTQPKAVGGGGAGMSREEIVLMQGEDMLAKDPGDFDVNEVKDAINKLGGMGKPHNVVLWQEVERINVIIKLYRITLKNLKLAVAGTIIMGVDLIEALDNIFDARPPPRWVAKSWVSPTIGLWFQSFMTRVEQLKDWMNKGKPACFWLTGFFNPNGFLTATMQDVARKHSGWALDEVVMYSEPTKNDVKDMRSGPEEGVYIYGLWIDGAGWDKKRICLVDQAPKVLFYELPVTLITGVQYTEKKSGWGFGDPKLTSGKVDMNKYSSPVYMYPRRMTGALGTYIDQIDLAAGGEPPMKWCLRGVCLLLQKD